MDPIKFPLRPGDKNENVTNLKSVLQLLIEKEIIRTNYSSRLIDMMKDEEGYKDGTQKAIAIFQEMNQLSPTGIIDENTAVELNKMLDKLGALNPTNEDSYVVSGAVLNSNGVALDGYIAEVFIITLQGDSPVGNAISGKDGAYTITYKNPSKDAPDIEIRAYKKDDPNNIDRSAVKYNASLVENLDVIVDAKKENLQSEFTLIVNDVKTYLGDLKLNDLKEDKEARQITYLSNKTGWDGRITAMMASAHQLGTSLEIDPSHVYAFLRAGVPSDEDSIKSLSIANAKEVIGNAIQKNIIPDSGQIDQTLKNLESLSVSHILKSKPFASVSSMDELLEIRLNTDQRNVFAQTQKQVGDDGGKLWSQLEQKGFSADTISMLQLDGKLGYLTGRNAPLVKRISDKYSLKNDLDLVSSGLYKSSEWKSIIENDVPEGITVDEYATNLANQVKLSYPTAVTAEMIKNEEVKIDSNVSKDEISSFFYSNESKFNIGVQPIKTWSGYNQLSPEAKNSAKMLERIYQLTPSDESMTALSKAGIHSAYHIAKFSKTEFIEKFGMSFPNKEEAMKVYTKANEVYSTSLGIATAYITSRTMPNVYSITGKPAKEQNEIIANPTLEELLGNMDYCTCEHCKSVLSPAAYFVELLQFIDRDDLPSNPINALKARRPDIENIQLSCENTNISLPYIDLVNEILEYYIMNDDLTNLKGHDTAEDTKQADLLAEPQFVNQAAYDELKKKVFPFNLPFHQPLETLRLLFKIWDITLEEMQSIFSTSLSSRKEALGFNEDEYKTLTDITFKTLSEYFGEPAGGTIDQLNTAIANGKVFSRRVGLSYEDLVSLLKSNYINPGHTLTPLFQKLKISLQDLNKFYTGGITDAQMDVMIPDDIDAAEYANDIKKWLRDNQQFIMGLILLTDISPQTVECNFAEVELRLALPDNANNKLTTIAYHKLHRFLRLQCKTGWSIQTLDSIIKILLPVLSDQLTDANIDEVFIKLFDRIANFKKLVDHLSYSEKKFFNLLSILDSSNSDSIRKVACAKILKLSLDEMEELTVITGIDPLADDMENDEPSLFKFIKTAQQLKAASLKVVDLAYILHHNDMTGKLTPSEDILLKNIKMLRDTLSVVERDNSIAPDNADFNFAKNKMLNVYDADTTNKFFGLLLNTQVFSAPLITTEEGLPDEIILAAPNLSFNPFKKEITYAGILPLLIKTSIENAVDSLVIADMDIIDTQPELNDFKSDFKNAIGQIFNEGEDELTTFATIYPALKIIYDAVIAEATPAEQTKQLVNLLLPDVKSRLMINGLQQALISILKTDADTVPVLTDKKGVVKSSADIAQPVMYDFLELQKPIIFDQNKSYQFYLDLPTTDNFLLFVAAPKDTVISLKLNEEIIIGNVTVGADEEVKNATPLSLKAGVLYFAELTLSALPASKTATLYWQTKGIGKITVPASSLYIKEQVDFAKTSLIRLSKAAQLKGLLKLTAPELDYFAADNIETKGFLNKLDTNGSISTVNIVALWKILELFIGFNLIKNDNEPEENTWVQILKNPAAKNSQGKSIIESINMWQEADLNAVLTHFAFALSDLSKLSVLKKVVTAMDAISSINYPSADVLTWITNDPSNNLVASIKATVKQKVTEASWLESMKTVSDPVRNLLRDALVAYILQYQKPSAEITTPNKLYEFFLIDVEMDACMKTSRIRMALSTIQLFIQRCLMNLEPLVKPEYIRAEQWSWIKRYRVWEANRKVFLYPENWLEPELRDNKSSLFKELEGELLQAEVTDESAELAFLNYLKKLDDIAKLDIIGTYLEENEKGNQLDDVLHVIGRTNGNTRQYYYRRFESGYWTPWEKISLTVEGDHIFPIVWRKRLFLFWVNTFEKAIDVNTDKSMKGIADIQWVNQKRINVEVNLCWGEYYKGKWTSPKSTELKRPMIIPNLTSFDVRKLQIYGRKEITEYPAGKHRERLIFFLHYIVPASPEFIGPVQSTSGVFTFTSKNAPPYLEYITDTELAGIKNNLKSTFFSPYASAEYGEPYHNQLMMPGRNFKVAVEQPYSSDKAQITESILTKKNVLTNSFVILPTMHPVEDQFEAPLSYTDEHSTFFIQPNERTYSPIWDYNKYYPMDETVLKYRDLPVLVVKPKAGWPPVEKLYLGEDVIINDPWRWNKDVIKTNENFNVVLPTNDTFTFGETTFDTAGKNMDAINKKLNQ